MERPRHCLKCAEPITNPGHAVVEISGDWYFTCRVRDMEGTFTILERCGRPLPIDPHGQPAGHAAGSPQAGADRPKDPPLDDDPDDGRSR